jgi:hypothetical protein
LKKKLGDRKED